jgi:succinate dehydrogenase / fumarate reductase membrane anchor subunit
MSTTNSSIRTPLARVRYLGSAHAGTSDFFRQRLTALGMLLLVLPVAIASCWHMKIGMQVVIEDYVHDEKLKLLAIIGNHFFTWVVALAAIYALVKLSSGV